ncbi:MAG: hypothetical protein ABR499_11560 [Gemmatimonadaceae bacterium]
MSKRLRNRVALLATLWATALVLAACIASISSGVRITERDKSALRDQATRSGNAVVRSPVKVHLADGSTIVYPQGIRVSGGVILPTGAARRSGPLNENVPVGSVPLDSVLGLESFHTNVNVPGSLVLSTLGTVAGFVGAVGLGVLIFGSCPTIYADSAGTPTLQAEVFATRISPLLEARDVDLLTARPDSAGILILEVRNEALETHYINHFELLEVRHTRDQRLIPDEHGRPLLVAAVESPASARDRAGRDLGRTLARVDGDVFSTDSGTLARASGTDPNDYIDIAVPRPPTDSAVVMLRLRNSLLNTVLLYEMMLAAPGARSLDWLAQDMKRIGPMLQFGRWYRRHFGLRVSVFDGRAFREVERHPTYGPVAWRQAATVVPVLERDSLRIRLAFAADEWRIDQVEIAHRFTRPRPRSIGIERVRATNDSVAAVTRRNLTAADERYLQTSPGERFWISFRTGPAPVDSARSFLLTSQGWYSEWIRGSWVKQATDSVPFKPSASALDRTLRRWEAQRDSLDRAFFATRVPVKP